MRPCFALEIETPKKYVLRGLWLGPRKAKRVFIFLHGLSGSAFSMAHVLDELVNSQTAVFSFNNKGFEWVSTLRRRVGKESERDWGGAAHEVFTDCVDDIEGAIKFARRHGAKQIYLVGHSTGCQKSIYWASKKSGGKAVKGIVLLGPISDYEAEFHRKGKAMIAKAEKLARSLVARGKAHELLPKRVWHETMDAQRFLSLYTKYTAENTFPYGRLEQKARALHAVKTPILVFWAEKDEYTDRPTKEIAGWFDREIKAPHKVVVVPGVGHGFKGAEKRIAREVRTFLK